MDFLPKIFERYDGFILHRVYINPWRYVLSCLPEDVRILFLSRRNLLLQFCSFRIMIMYLLVSCPRSSLQKKVSKNVAVAVILIESERAKNAPTV